MIGARLRAQGSLRVQPIKAIAMSTNEMPSRQATRNGAGDVVVLVTKANVSAPPKARLMPASDRPMIRIRPFVGGRG